MFTRKLLPLIGIAVWVAVALTAWPHAFSHRGAAFVVHADSSLPSACSDFHPHFDRHDAVFASEERTISRAEAANLRIEATNGSLQVQGGDSDSYTVILCKATEAGNDSQSLFSKLHLQFQNGLLSVAEPSSHSRWAAALFNRAPKQAAMDIQSQNGPVTLSHVDGKLKVRTQNGPLSVTGCTGDLDLSSQNGPLTLDRNSGKLNVRSENGPLSVSLNLPGWNGSGLDAHVQNGPLTLHVPPGYTSGVLLESQGPSPFSCGASVCSEGRKTWDTDNKRVEFGPGPAVVRLSAANGPISVH